ncbi:hypothetical protein OKW38_000495 [Paraburkholderia sp. MM5496-R1]
MHQSCFWATFGHFQPFAFMFQRSFKRRLRSVERSLIGHSRTMSRFRRAILLQPSTPKQVESRTKKSGTAARIQNLVSKSNDFIDPQIQVIATGSVVAYRDPQTMRSVHRCVGQGRDASFLKSQHYLGVERLQCFLFAQRIGQQVFGKPTARCRSGARAGQDDRHWDVPVRPAAGCSGSCGRSSSDRTGP